MGGGQKGWATVFLGVHTDLSFQEESVCIACPKPLRNGENYGVGQLSLCSQVRLLPLGVSPMPALAMLHIQSFP